MAEPSPEPTFEDFWTLFPRHVARKDAARAWARLKPDDQLAALVAVAAWRRIWIRRAEPEFIPHAATWLNGSRWEDDLPSTPMNGSAVLSTFKPMPAKDRRAIPADVLAEIRRLKGKP